MKYHYIFTYEYYVQKDLFSTYIEDDLTAKDILDAYEKALKTLNKINAVNKDVVFRLSSLYKVNKGTR